MIWDNFSILEQTAPSPVAHARTCCEDFCVCREGEMTSVITEMFDAFGPHLNTFMSVGILLQYFRGKLLQFEWSKTVLNLIMSCFIYYWPSYIPLLLLQELHITSLQVSHMSKNDSFSLTQQKHSSWIYLDIAAFEDFKVSLLLLHAREEFARLYHDRKVETIIISLTANLSFAWIVRNAWCFIKAQLMTMSSCL